MASPSPRKRSRSGASAMRGRRKTSRSVSICIVLAPTIDAPLAALRQDLALGVDLPEPPIVAGQDDPGLAAHPGIGGNQLVEVPEIVARARPPVLEVDVVVHDVA